MRRLLTNPAERRRLGQNAQTLVRDQQGATDKTVQILGQYFR
jgi:3-deoxy-D-manno-octulosonic-acid transferase